MINIERNYAKDLNFLISKPGTHHTKLYNISHKGGGAQAYYNYRGLCTSTLKYKCGSQRCIASIFFFFFSLNGKKSFEFHNVKILFVKYIKIM